MSGYHNGRKIYHLSQIPEWVLDNLDTLNFECEGTQARDISRHARNHGSLVHRFTIYNVIEGYALPTPRTYNAIARYYDWQLWDEVN